MASITDDSNLTYASELSKKPNVLCRLKDFADNTPICFILMTNATRVRLAGIHGHVQEAKLGDDLMPDKIKMGAEFWGAWSKFLKEEVREGVKIQFVFTRSA